MSKLDYLGTGRVYGDRGTRELVVDTDSIRRGTFAGDEEFSGRDDDSSYTHFWPFFGVKNEGANYHKYYFLYPVFAIEGDPVTDRSGFELLWPLIDYERAQVAKTLELLFIPIRWGAEATAPTLSPAPSAGADSKP